MISLIAAMARNRVIGLDNRMPWNLPEDLKHFKRVTHGHPIVMGRKTYESIGRLLPGRENRIVSRQADYAVQGARVFGSLHEACLDGLAAPVGGGPDHEVFVIGGGQIYAEALPFADRLYLTLIDDAFTGDAYFPEWRAADFREISRENHFPRPANGTDPGRTFGFAFVVMERVNAR